MWHMRQTRPLPTRVTAAFLAAITAFSCVPVQALAEAEDALAVQSQAESAVAVQSSVTFDDVTLQDSKGNDLTHAGHTVKVGEKVKLVATYWDDDEWDDVELSSSEYAQLSYQWYVGTKQSSAPTASGYEPISGATSRELTLTSDLAGKYVACKVTYGSSSWQYKFTESLKAAVQSDEAPSLSEDGQTLAAAKQKLSTWKPSPKYGTDTNIVSMLQAKLADLGYGNVRASLKSADFSATDPAQQGGIVSDGTITYFFLSAADKTVYSDYSLLRQFKPTYVLSLGSESLEFTPSSASTLPWDDAKVKSYLEEQMAAADLTVSLKAGAAASDVTEETLPGALMVNGKKVATVTWSSSDQAAAKLTESYDANYNTVYKVSYAHGMSAQDVTLTATVTLFVSGYGNGPSSSLAKSYPVTVAAKSAEDIAAEKAELDEALGRIVLKDFVTKEVVDADAVEADLQLPRTSRSGIDAPSGAKLSYSSSNDAVAKVNGYRVFITRDIEDGTNEATITATLTKDGVTATRDITIRVKPIPESEIDEAVAFMTQVKAGYQNALLGENESADAVSKDLATFAEAAPTADGGVEYRKGKDSQYAYVVADDLPGYDPMASTNWRTYRSSDTSVVADETLRVTQPAADTLVTVTSNLTYEKYRSLAEAHPENAKLQSLVDQQVTATYRVVGTTDHTDPQISVPFQLVGIDADGTDEVWSDASRQVAYGSTADELIESVLTEMGLEHTSSTTAYGYYLKDITSADGRKLGYDQDTHKYWQLFVNGVASDVTADQVALKPGDSVVLYYSAYGASIDDINNAKVKVSVSFVGPDANGNNSVWAQQTDVKLTSGSTAADLTEQALQAAGLAHTSSDTAYGYYLSDITSADGRKLGYDQDTGKYWQLFVNGKSSDLGASQVTLKPGDNVQWVYSAYGENPLDSVIINPLAPRPDWDADWSGFGNGGSTTLVNVPTPSDAAEELWKVNLKTDGDPWVALGDPVIAGGYVFLTTNTDLIKIDSTGAVVGRVNKGGSTSYFSRPVYANGLIVCANDDGSLAAFSAETLECVWKTKALDAPAVGGRYQANSTMTLANGCVYAEFVAGVSYSGTASAGAMTCVDLSTGEVRWTKLTVKSGGSTGEGYYWAGACASGSDLVIGDEGGRVNLVDGATGEVKSSVSIGDNPIRATVVSAGTEGGKQVFLAVGRQPATLYKIVRDGDELAIESSCAFANTATSTPAVAGGKAYIGGNDASYNGQFTVIDLASMTVEKTVDMGARANVQASPVVSVQGDDTYVYFTCNKNPGSLYRYSQSTGEVAEVYTPSGSEANYCTASVVADAAGNLYYTNDSGTLFALKAAAGYRVSFDSNGGSTVPSATPVQNKPMAPVADPVRAGYRFLGWYTADGSKWDFSTPVTGDMTLYAKWESTAPVIDPSTPTQPTNPGTQPGGNGGLGGGTDDNNGNAPNQPGAPKPSIALAPNANDGAAAAGGASDGEKADGRQAKDGVSASGDAKPADTAATTSADTGAEAAREAQSQTPVWPFVGIGLGFVAIIAALLAGRKRKGEEA